MPARATAGQRAATALYSWALTAVAMLHHGAGSVSGTVVVHCIVPRAGVIQPYAAVELCALLPRCGSVHVAIIELASPLAPDTTLWLLRNDVLPAGEELATQQLELVRYAGSYAGFAQTLLYRKPTLVLVDEFRPSTAGDGPDWDGELAFLQLMNAPLVFVHGDAQASRRTQEFLMRAGLETAAEVPIDNAFAPLPEPGTDGPRRMVFQHYVPARRQLVWTNDE